jgi:hypothetical protein
MTYPNTALGVPAAAESTARYRSRLSALAAAGALLASLSGSATYADQQYHSQHYDLTPVNGAPLVSGFVENIHANGPTVFAHERYVLNGVSPDSLYQVVLSIWTSNSTCSGSPTFQLHPAELQTNAAGNAEAGHTFSPQVVEQAGLLGHTVSAKWQLWTGGSPNYETGCEVVPLD